MASATILTAAEIGVISTLRELARRLPPDLRLVVVLVGDGSTLLTAAPRQAPPPPDPWITAKIEQR